MIKKLYDLKKTQTDQKLMQKGQLMSKLEQLDAEIMLTQSNINGARVQRHGAISDFTILTMHKNTMRAHIQKLQNEKNEINIQLDELIKQIIELQKETEQFGHIIEEEKKEFLRRIILTEQEASEEYIQSKYISE